MINLADIERKNYKGEISYVLPGGELTKDLDRAYAALNLVNATEHSSNMKDAQSKRAAKPVQVVKLIRTVGASPRNFIGI